MSLDDVYRIEELEEGQDLFSVYHHDVEDYPREPLVVGVSLKEATRFCDEQPAEYGYYIAWIDGRDDPNTNDSDASWKDVADDFDKLLGVDDDDVEAELRGLDCDDDDPLCTHKCDYHND